MPKVADEKYLDSLKGMTAAKKPLQRSPSKLIIDASGFSSKKERNGVHFSVINGLGINGKGVTAMPLKRKPGSLITKASYLEYRLKLAPGEHTITIKCLPTQSIDADKKLRLGIPINNSPVQLMNIHSERESKQWKENVLRGYAGSKMNTTVNQEATVLRIYFPEPGLVVNTIEIE
jgi:hypothetical protein